MIERFKRFLQAPHLLVRVANRQYYHRRYGPYNPTGIDIFEQDWDILLILDGCRADDLQRHYQNGDIGGDFTTVESRGSKTPQWLYGNLHDKDDLHDTVYITALGQYESKREQFDCEFHAVHNLWDNPDYWSDELAVVHPDQFRVAVEDIATQYPEKRLLLHACQPHYPFLDPESDGQETVFKRYNSRTPNVWREFHTWGESPDPEEVRRLYQYTLEYALDTILPAVQELPGKLVVSSDHGNLFGERARPLPIREYGHPLGLYVSELTAVPWVEFDSDIRRDITPEAPESTAQTVSDATVEENLKALGYTE